METEKELSIRLHQDWYHQCRSCDQWLGDRTTVLTGVCNNYKSYFFFEETRSNGRCKEWDSFDYETALEVIDGKWNALQS